MKIKSWLLICGFSLFLFSNCNEVEEKEETTTDGFETTNSDSDMEYIFLELIDTNSGRTVIIEENDNSIWAYVLTPDNQNIDFDGFICSTIDPVEANSPLIQQKMKEGFAPPLSVEFTNEYSVLKEVNPNDIKVVSGDSTIEIYLKNEKYLVLDLTNRTGYSKAISKPGGYGNPLK